MSKKKAERIDRKQKTIKIGKYRIAYGKLCMFGLIFIMAFSGVGFYFTGGKQPTNDQPTNTQVQIRVVFENATQVTRIVNLEEGKTAADAFSQVVEITSTQTAQGPVIDSVTYKNATKTRTETHEWVFYGNGIVILRDPTQVTPRNGDLIELIYEESPFK